MAEEFDELLQEQRHQEFVAAIRGLSSSIDSFKSDDPELRQLIAQNINALEGFIAKLLEVTAPQKPQVFVETNQDKVVESINKLANSNGQDRVVASVNRLVEVLEKNFIEMDKRIKKLENKPIPERLRPVRDAFNQTIEYVQVEYKK